MRPVTSFVPSYRIPMHERACFTSSHVPRCKRSSMLLKPPALAPLQQEQHA